MFTVIVLDEMAIWFVSIVLTEESIKMKIIFEVLQLYIGFSLEEYFY